VKSNGRKILRSLNQPLFFLDNYLKGATYGSGETNLFTPGTPPGAPTALFFLDKSYHVINQRQHFTRAHVNA
jgi:hypothetical protein